MRFKLILAFVEDSKTDSVLDAQEMLAQLGQRLSIMLEERG